MTEPRAATASDAGLADTAVPAGIRPASTAVDAAAGVCFAAARWTGDELARLATHLGARGAAALDGLDDRDLLAAWSDTVAAFRDPRSAERQALEAPLAAAAGLSRPGLAAGLDAVLGGVGRPHAARLLTRARSFAGSGTAGGGPGPSATDGVQTPRPALVVLAGNVPGLAVQPLLPALALRQPLLLKSATAEPLFAPAFVKALRRREPAIGEGVAAVAWRGGDTAVEAAVLGRVGLVLAYGGRQAVESLQARAPGRVVDFGPKLSVAVIGRDVPAATVAAGLARDVALFDQRGCLSVQVVFTVGLPQARALAAALVAALDEVAGELPPGPVDPLAAARVHQQRVEAEMRGVALPQLPLARGTVLLTPAPPLAPSPGVRTVRVHPLGALDQLPALLEPWRGKLQGAALAGDDAWQLVPALESLGVSRCTPPGELQTPDASWHNGGRDPLEVFAAGAGGGGLPGGP
jgi:hypothetical protein